MTENDIKGALQGVVQYPLLPPLQPAPAFTEVRRI